jgi:thioredoxin 1
MALTDRYETVEPARAAIDALPGPVVLEFGTSWCGYCQAAQPLLATAFAPYPDVRHIKVEDGSGRPLGRSFRVKLWPTLVFLRDGVELARLVRPADAAAIGQALGMVTAAPPPGAGEPPSG